MKVLHFICFALSLVLVQWIKESAGEITSKRKTAMGAAVLWLKTIPNLAVLLSVLFFIIITGISLDFQDKRRRKNLEFTLGPRFTHSVGFRTLFPDVLIHYVVLLIILLAQLLLVSATNFLPLVILNLITGVMACVTLIRSHMRIQLLSICWKIHFAILLGKLIELAWPFPTDFYELVLAGILLFLVCVFIILTSVDSKDVEHQILYFMSKSSNSSWTYIISENSKENSDSIDNNNNNATTLPVLTVASADLPLDSSTGGGTTTTTVEEIEKNQKILDDVFQTAPDSKEIDDEAELFATSRSILLERGPINSGGLSCFPSDRSYDGLSLEETLEEDFNNTIRRNKEAYEKAKAEEAQLPPEELEALRRRHELEGSFNRSSFFKHRE